MLVYAANGELGDACVDRIRPMTKDVEVGDVFTGKVVKTTTFGAFVELTKGTDGLLHISNISPGQRAESVEDVVNRGDEVNVRVVEVNKERGRIGLRLADDPEIAGKTVEELARSAPATVAATGAATAGPRVAAATVTAADRATAAAAVAAAEITAAIVAKDHSDGR